MLSRNEQLEYVTDVTGISTKKAKVIFCKVREVMEDVDLLTVGNDVILSVENMIRQIQDIVPLAELQTEGIDELLSNHTCRVLICARELLKYVDDDNKKTIDVNCLRVAIMLHDIGKLFALSKHSIYSYFISVYILEKIQIPIKDKEIILDMVLKHSLKDGNDNCVQLSFVDCLIMDADMLEDFGVRYRIHLIRQSKYIKELGIKRKILFDSLVREIEEVKIKLIRDKRHKIQTVAGKIYFDTLMRDYDSYIEHFNAHRSNIHDRFSSIKFE